MTPDLTTRYLGLELASPLIASASPLSKRVASAKQLCDAGAGAIVMFSLFEEEIRYEEAELEHHLDDAMGFSEASSLFPAQYNQGITSSQYLDLLADIKAVIDIPLIASFNGISLHSWVEHARHMAEAGADALELNLYHLPTRLDESDAEVEARYLQTLAAIKSAIDIPVAIKMMPYFTTLGRFAKRLDEAGADGLVLFNRLYQPDFDLDRLTITSHLEFSTPAEIRLPLFWTALLSGKLNCSLAAGPGIKSHIEVIKYLLAGADATPMAAVLLEHGADHLIDMRTKLSRWMEERGFASISELKGRMNQENVANPAALERVNYVQTLGLW